MTAEPTVFLLVRHAESAWNAAGRWQGQADPPLSERGVAQARALARALADARLDALYASDLRRALHTAEILGEAVGLVPVPDPRLRELDVGRWEGLTRARIQAFDGPALARFDTGDADAPAGGGETRRALERRIRGALAALAAAHPGRRIGVVTHLGAVRAVLAGTDLDNAGTAWADARRLGAPPGGRAR